MGPKKDQNIDKARLKTRKCQYNDRGYCKHGDKCYNIYTDKVCDDKNCSGQCDNFVQGALIIRKTCVLTLILLLPVLCWDFHRLKGITY